MASTDQTSNRQSQRFAAFDAALAAAIGRPVERLANDPLDLTLTEVERLSGLLVETLRGLPDEELVRQASTVEQTLASERLLAVARAVGSSGDSNLDRRRARNTLGVAGRSIRAVNADARRAAAVAANDRLGDHLASGSIAPDAIDALNKAADSKTGAIPGDVLDAVDGLMPDQATRVVDHYLEESAPTDNVEKRYQQQMQARRVYQYEVPARNGQPTMAGIGIEGPEAIVDRIRAFVDAAADRTYRDKGGRDRATSTHDTLPQRQFDALYEALIGESGSVSTSAGRPSVVVTIDGTELFNNADEAVATQIGSGLLPRPVLDSYLREARMSLLIRGLDGTPLWLGRARRHASDAQFLALAVRDRGCVLCRAHINRCDAHHLIPWTAPGRGQTNIDQMALLCHQCHRDLHHRNHTLHSATSQAGVSVWTTRPAEPHEVPAPAPQHRQRE